MISRTTNPLPQPLEQLVDAMLRANEDDCAGWMDVFLVAATAKALAEHGIKARAVSVNVVLDPEQWERPYSMVALNVRGRIYGGRGRYGWEAIAEAYRDHEGIAGDYQDISRSYQVSLENLKTLNPNRDGQLVAELNRCRALVEAFQLEKHTLVARQDKPGRGPRL